MHIHRPFSNQEYALSRRSLAGALHILINSLHNLHVQTRRIALILVIRLALLHTPSGAPHIRVRCTAQLRFANHGTFGVGWLEGLELQLNLLCENLSAAGGCNEAEEGG